MPPTIEQPYVGLGHFTEDYADRFFGRDVECSLIIGNLRAARLTLLYAESGVGKSSVLRAGVVARLHGFAEHDLQARGSPRLVPVVFSSWSDAPVAALIRAIGDAARPYLPDDSALELSEDDLERAIEVASTALDATLLVVLDQFEEYFLYPDDQVEERRVAAQLARCVNRPDLRANFLISIREDSYARLGDLFRGRVTNVYANFLHLDFLDRVGARESIEKPIERVNELRPDSGPYELEPALVDAVLDQVGRGQVESAEGDGQGDGAEPRDEVETTYLQLVMRRLWEEEAGTGSQRLRLRTLEGLGGAQAVIRGHLDRAMEDEEDGAGLTDAQRLVAASIFHFLVTSGGTKIALTATDLSDLSGLPVAEIDPVLQHLSSPALHILRPVVSEDGREPRFEIFHDALARPIVDWRTRVEEAELDARVARERAEKESAQRAAAEAERRAASERKRKRLALALLGIAVTLLVVGAFAALIHQEHVADQKEADTQSLRVVQRIAELSDSPSFDPAVAGLADVEAYRLSPNDEARGQALAELQLNPSMATIVAGHTNEVESAAYWPGEDKFVTGGEDKTVRLWDSGGHQLGYPLVNDAAVMSVAVSEPRHRTRIVAAGLEDGVVRLWRVDRSDHVRPLKAISVREVGSVEGLAFNPRTPTMLAVGGSRGGVALLDLTHPRSPARLGVRSAGFVSDLAFDASGRRLFVAGVEGQEWTVSAAGFADLRPAVVDPRTVWSVATAPNGSYAFGIENGVDLWDASRGRELHLHQSGIVESVEFTRDGSVLVTGGADFNVTTWDLSSGRPFGPPRMAQWIVYDLAISPDGGTIAAASGDGLRLWPLEPEHGLATTVGSLGPREGFPRISSLAAGADGQFAAAAGRAGTSIWKLPDLAETGAVPQPLARIPGRSHAVAYRGNTLAVARGDSFVLWDTGATCSSMPAKPCRLGAPRKPHSDHPVSSLALAKYGDELLLVSSGEKKGEGVVNLWDVTDTARTGEVSHLSTREAHSASDAEPHTTINQVAFSRENPLVAVATMDGKTRVWDVSRPSVPKGIHIAHAHGNEDQPVYAVAFSPDGELLASGGGDQQVVLWAVDWHASGATTVKLTPTTLFQPQAIFSLAFSPNGEALVAGDGEGRTCIYEVQSRARIGSEQCLLGHTSLYVDEVAIRAVRFAHPAGGGAPLLTAGIGQPIVAWNPILWNLNDTERVDRAVVVDVCALAGRNLSSDEWIAIFGATKFADDRHRTCPRYRLPEP